MPRFGYVAVSAVGVGQVLESRGQTEGHPFANQGCSANLQDRSWQNLLPLSKLEVTLPAASRGCIRRPVDLKPECPAIETSVRVCRRSLPKAHCESRYFD